MTSPPGARRARGDGPVAAAGVPGAPQLADVPRRAAEAGGCGAGAPALLAQGGTVILHSLSLTAIPCGVTQQSLAVIAVIFCQYDNVAPGIGSSSPRTSKRPGLAAGGEVTFMRPCMFHSGVSNTKHESGLKMTLQPIWLGRPRPAQPAQGWS